MKFHEYANLFPMMPEMDLMRLAEDIKEKGQSDPVITLDGMILDGRNRYRACEINGITPRCEEYSGDDPLGFVISHNLHRRHLSESQRAMVAAKWARLKRGGESGVHKTNPPIGGLPQPTETKTREEASKLLNVGISSIDRAKRIVANGIPEMKEMVENGKLSVHKAWGLVKLPENEQRDAIESGAEGIRLASERGHSLTRKPSNDDEDAETLVVDGVAGNQIANRKRMPSWTPDDADRLWLLAKTDLAKILPNDKSRERVLLEVIEYAQNRIKNNK